MKALMIVLALLVCVAGCEQGKKEATTGGEKPAVTKTTTPPAQK